jgi:hypothetical protein
MKAFSRVETLATATAFDRALRRKDQLVLVEFVSVRARWARRARTMRKMMRETRGRGAGARRWAREDARTRGLTTTSGLAPTRFLRIELQPFE